MRSPERPRPSTAGRASALAVAAAAAVFGACELEEVTIVDVEPVVVAEVYADLKADPAENEVRAYLHWTAGIDTAGLPDLGSSRIELRSSGGLTLLLNQEGQDDCIGSFPQEEVGACFRGDEAEVPGLAPGDLLEVDVTLPGGGMLFGAARIPEAFELDGVPSTCRLAANTLLPLTWSRSDGAWAYVNETSIRNLPNALRPEGIVVEDDPLYLLGLSIADRDTTIVFPSEFGVFNRFDLEQDLAVRLQSGLPNGALAEVTITAVDRNYVNWARGGNFNPSGQVRVPSLRGEGTGVLAATVSRRFVALTDPSSSLPSCSS